MNAPSGTEVSGGHLAESPLAPPQNSKDTSSCSQQHCSGHGHCATQGNVIHCHCVAGYQGEFCQEKETRRSHVGVILGVFCLFAAFMGVAFIFGKRQGCSLFACELQLTVTRGWTELNCLLSCIFCGLTDVALGCICILIQGLGINQRKST